MGYFSIHPQFVKAVARIIIALVANYWFIPVAFICLMYAWTSNKLHIKIIPALIISFIISLLPLKVQPLLPSTQAMLPFFMLGLACRQYNVIEIIRKNKLSATIVSIIVFVLLFFYLTEDKFFYHAPDPILLKRALNSIFYLIVGISGIVLSILLADFILKKYKNSLNWFCQSGQYTLTIYFLQQLLIVFVLKLNLNIHTIWIPLLMSVSSYYLLTEISMRMQHNKFPRIYLCGKVK